MKHAGKMLSLWAVALILLTGCVSKRKYLDSQVAVRLLKSDSATLANRVNNLEAMVAQQKRQIQALSAANEDATAASSRLQSQLSSSKEAYAAQQQKLEQLQALLDQQKQQAEALRQKMADALSGFSASDLSVTQKNGKVYVSLSENLLFPSGSAAVNAQGKDALGKLAEVLITNPDISVNIEGHTDSIPIRIKYQDNWALSTARSTAIVRILVDNYHVDPTKIVASGHSWYDPVDTNSTPEGRARNRRTEIILSPKLDELYKLLGT
ncbi:OmpA/MotB family protein [Chitinophaga japonensis]|uniref:Chemotaxis protein MotB n=1 Tax=Chitinophaga japonensis TaxID=104662 RepID=A0A562T5R5_CHIJA|nr:flagellar motor protein MotB [Chitinophaga japonensis]TWI88594.1 chemotaxis protein MotB [Chitinophaga japonensis]